MKKNIYQALLPVVFAAALLLSAGTALAGGKLKKLRKDACRIEKGILLVPPVLPDSFMLKKWERKGKTEKAAAYLAHIRKANENLRKALEKHYDFSKLRFLYDEPAMRRSDTRFADLAKYDADSFFVLQFGHEVQFATDPPKRIRKYERDFLAIYANDGTERLYLQAGKIRNFDRLSYAEGIVENMVDNLERYARQRKNKKEKNREKVRVRELAGAVVPEARERLYGRDSTVFGDRGWQTVRTEKDVEVFQRFGGGTKAGGRVAAVTASEGGGEGFEATVRVPKGTRLHIGYGAGGSGAVVLLPAHWPAGWIRTVRDLGTGETSPAGDFRGRHPELFGD